MELVAQTSVSQDREFFVCLVCPSARLEWPLQQQQQQQQFSHGST